MSIEGLFGDAEAAQEAWSELIGYLAKGRYDFDRSRPAFDAQSLAQLNRRAAAFFELMASIRPKDAADPLTIAAGARVPEMRGHLQTFQGNVQNAITAIKPHWRDDSLLKDFGDNLQWEIHSGASSTRVDVTSQLQAAYQSTNYLLSTLGALLPLARADAIGDVVERAEALQRLSRSAESARDEATKHAKLLEQLSAAATSGEEKVRVALANAESALTAIGATQGQATTSLAEVAALVEKIKATGSSAETLEETIKTYQSRFDAFQQALNDRNTAFGKFETDSAAASEKHAARESEIDRITSLANAMISGATTAGLAKSMEDARARYEARMNSARRGFYVAVVLLILSAIPLVTYLMPGLVEGILPGFVKGQSDDSPYSVLGKILLLLPATWLTAFFTRAYADFFHLEREYAHKAALAMSVDGFKRQAEKYQEEITAEVFLEIRNNPAKGRPVEAASHPLYDVLSKAISTKLGSKALDAASPKT